MSSPHESFLKSMAEFQSVHPDLELPPKSFTEMKGEVVEFDPEGKLAVKFPFDPRFTNPMMVFQGGMLCAAADNVLGPLSYFVTRRPCVTLDLHTRYVRPFLAKDQSITVRAKVNSKTKQMLLMEASIHTADERLVAVVTTQFMILS